MDAPGGGFEHDGCLVVDVVGDVVELGFVGHQLRSPAAAGAGTETDLDTVVDGPRQQIAVVVAVAGSSAGKRRLLAAGLGAEGGFDGHSATVVEGADDLVAGYEGERHVGLEVARRGALDGGEVAAADTGQAGMDPVPARARELGWVDVAQPQRADLGTRTGHDPRRHRRRGVAQLSSLEHQCLHGGEPTGW